MNNRGFQTAAAFLLGVVGLHIVGYFFPSPFTWGFHSFGFLPPGYIIAYVVLAVVIMILAGKNKLDAAFDSLAGFMQKSEYQFLITAIGIFVVAAVYFRVRVPLLGDGFFLVKNFAEALRSGAPLLYRNEPLGTYYYFSVVKLFQPTTYSGFLSAFLAADIILGIGYILCSYFAVKTVFNEPVERLLIFGLLLGIPLQLYFGYVEIYGAVLFALSLYILLSVLYFTRKISSVLLPIAFLFLALVHYLAVLLFPSLLFILWREWKQKRWKPLLAGAGLAAGASLAFLFLVNFDLSRFSASVPHSHILPLVPSDDFNEQSSTPYTLLSPSHALDLFNACILMAAPAVLMVGLGARSARRLILQQSETLFLLAGLVPVLGFFFLVKFDLGAAKDWDVFAPYGFLALLLGAMLFAGQQLGDRRAILSLLFGLSMIQTFAFVKVNSAVEPSVNRYKALLDRRTMSDISYYTAALHLVLYYHQIGDTTSPIRVWDQYVKEFPQDPRGYQNIISNLEHSGPAGYDRISSAYDGWLRVNPQDTLAREAYATFCLDAGNERYANGSLAAAGKFYEKAIALDPELERAYNNLGSIYAQQRNFSGAVELFKQAIDLDSAYSDPYYNLGSAYEDMGKKQEGIAYKQRAARLGNSPAQTQLQKRGISW